MKLMHGLREFILWLCQVLKKGIWLLGFLPALLDYVFAYVPADFGDYPHVSWPSSRAGEGMLCNKGQCGDGDEDSSDAGEKDIEAIKV